MTRYQSVTVVWNDGATEPNALVAINAPEQIKESDYDERIFFYFETENEYTNALQPNNGEDFYLVEESED